MKIIIANNKKSLKLTKAEWMEIGKKTGWIKIDASKKYDLFGFLEPESKDAPAPALQPQDTPKHKRSKKTRLHPDSIEFLAKIQRGEDTPQDREEYRKKHPEGIVVLDS